MNTRRRLLSARFGIRSIPTLLLIRHGREIARQAGAMSTDDIRRRTLSTSSPSRAKLAERMLGAILKFLATANSLKSMRRFYRRRRGWDSGFVMAGISAGRTGDARPPCPARGLPSGRRQRRLFAQGRRPAATSRLNRVLLESQIIWSSVALPCGAPT